MNISKNVYRANISLKSTSYAELTMKEHPAIGDEIVNQLQRLKGNQESAYFHNNLSSLYLGEREDPVLLIADNYTSHCSLPAVLFCREIHITFLTLPPHASHVLQPLDKCVLALLKALYSPETEKWLVQNPGKAITLYKVSGIFQKAYSATSRVQFEEKAFRVTGIELNNPDLISEDCYSPSLVTLAPLDKDCTVAVAPEENEVSPSTSQIDFSIQSILPIPRHEQRGSK
ncbi:hypothetical protein AVEN_19965-1 [Araneus ventricosus]|uniref:DDE-1 domain-containing protein n=1 Tax=Araneus ventricosus TaxID=182803 RepID=A0A4Y2LKY2_ARAVE|nr:hypothetical protein AVEN_19965-1 [Araneus ventricosus]